MGTAAKFPMLTISLFDGSYPPPQRVLSAELEISCMHLIGLPTLPQKMRYITHFIHELRKMVDGEDLGRFKVEVTCDDEDLLNPDDSSIIPTEMRCKSSYHHDTAYIGICDHLHICIGGNNEPPCGEFTFDGV